VTNWLGKAYWNAFTLWHTRREARLPYLPLERIRAIQDRRVRQIIAHAYDTVPYYRTVMDEAGLRPGDLQTAADLAQLPFTTPEQLAADPAQFRSRRYTDSDSFEIATTGTSGQPKRIRYDYPALFQSLAHGYRQRIILAHFVGHTLGYRELAISRPDSASSRMRAFYEANSWVPRGVELTRCTLTPVGRFEDHVQTINAFRPHVIWGYGFAVGAIYRWAWEHGASLWQPKAIWYHSDHMAEPDRRLIEDRFNVPVLSTYQAIETLLIAYQCEHRAGFHLDLDYLAIRVVDDRGNDVGPGETGQAIVSNLFNRATVLLNYKLGDMVTLGEGPCPCGRTLPTIARLSGRTGAMILRPDGQRIYDSVVLEKLFAVPGVAQVQLIQEDLNHLRLNVVCAGNADWDAVRRGLSEGLRAALGDLPVQITRLEAIPPGPGGKVQAAISKIRGEG
jgi:phenylacetate-CoA ligase